MRAVRAIDRERENTGWSDQARYCYAVWMRHLLKAAEHGLVTDPKFVVELGPGDSLGIGLCSVLCGADHLASLDAFAYANVTRTHSVMDGLVDLLRHRADIPQGSEYPEIAPYLSSGKFPTDVLSPSRLATALEPSRLERIRTAITAGMDGRDHGGIRIEYVAPWSDTSALECNTADLVISQAVMEHVRDLDLVYLSAREWLRATGHLSFQIDFRSHNTSVDWNGHWMYNEEQWRKVQNDKTYRWINREPLSSHLRILRENGLRVAGTVPVTSTDGLQRRHVAALWQRLTAADLRTSGALVLAGKVAHWQDTA